MKEGEYQNNLSLDLEIYLFLPLSQVVASASVKPETRGIAKLYVVGARAVGHQTALGYKRAFTIYMKVQLSQSAFRRWMIILKKKKIKKRN